jgi:hypothetical protein
MDKQLEIPTIVGAPREKIAITWFARIYAQVEAAHEIQPYEHLEKRTHNSAPKREGGCSESE